VQSEHADERWLREIEATLLAYRRMIDATVDQLSDEALWQRPGDEFNSVAVLLRHLGGNLKSRWSDFMTTDGEKPNRNREKEFEDWEGNRQSLLEYFDEGWAELTSAVKSLDSGNIERTISIRGEPHSIAQALLRSLTHITYHTGQITMAARMVHNGPWKWLTIAPGNSAEFNSQNWGEASSRAVFAQKTKSDKPDK